MKRFLLIALLAFSACSTTKNLPQSSQVTSIADGKLFASLFQQQAAEYKALCFQAFNFAKLRIDLSINNNSGKPKAIITDIDETILDNSAYDVKQVLQGKDYEPASWSQWTSLGIADTVPGAPSFLHYAASRGITIFYITNRDEAERAGTLSNLKKYNLPNADNEHLVLKQGISSKEGRRQEILKNYDVVLLMGDNLADFSELYDKRSVEDRNLVTRQLAAEFGNRFIILPNPVYGDWETALYHYNSKLTMAQKDSIIRKTVKGY
jgi:5'-nucleotidase (lipoprotein e(P4) family)